jgi:beta-1,4-mannooligosaccharide/beta-1,4-mannosyl-N-acetylglucosamine phosphorylase
MRYGEPGLLQRHPGNPILTPKTIPHGYTRVYNPAACRYGDDYLLLFSTDREDPQRLGLARSRDGIHFAVDKDPIFSLDPDECGCINDPRITFIDDWYYLAYCSDPSLPVRAEGIHLCIARTRDFRTFERIFRSEPDNRNGVILPEKINGLYARLDRPFRRGYRTEHGYDVWISFSPDMELAWGSHKIGPAAPPVKTSRGWLTFFHGAEIAPKNEGWLPWIGDTGPGRGKVYRAGLMLLDLEDPSRIIGRMKRPVLEPGAPYEMDPSYRPNVIFPCGIIEEPGGELKIYYGASDTHIALAIADKEQLAAACLEEETG